MLVVRGADTAAEQFPSQGTLSWPHDRCRLQSIISTAAVYVIVSERFRQVRYLVDYRNPWISSTDLFSVRAQASAHFRPQDIGEQGGVYGEVKVVWVLYQVTASRML